jgi:hypothetical protein
LGRIRLPKGNLQASAEEHEHNTKLTTETHLEVLDIPQRQGYNNQVENDVDASGHPSLDIQVKAFSGMFAVPTRPGEVDWGTLQCSCRDERDHVQYAKRYRNLDGASEPLMGKDSEIE